MKVCAGQTNKHDIFGICDLIDLFFYAADRNQLIYDHNGSTPSNSYDTISNVCYLLSLLAALAI